MGVLDKMIMGQNNAEGVWELEPLINTDGHRFLYLQRIQEKQRISIIILS